MTNLFGSPGPLAAARAGGQEPSRRLPTLKRVISAGAPVSAEDPGTTVAAARPAGSSLHAVWRDRIACRSPRSAAARSWAKPATRPTGGWAYVSAGPSRASTRRIIQIRDDPIPVWSDDLLRARRRDRRDRRGRPGRDASSTLTDPRQPAWPRSPTLPGETFFHRMGDLGYRDNAGPALVLRPEVAPGDPANRRRSSPSPASRSSTRIPTSRGRPWSESSGTARSMPVICIEPVATECADRNETASARTARAWRGVPSHLEDQDDSVSSVVSRRYSPQRQDLSREAGRLGFEEAVMSSADLGDGAGDGRRRLSRHGPDQAARRARAGRPQPEPARLPASAGPGGRASPGRCRRRLRSCTGPSTAARPSSTPPPRPASGARSRSTSGSTSRALTT